MNSKKHLDYSCCSYISHPDLSHHGMLKQAILPKAAVGLLQRNASKMTYTIYISPKGSGLDMPGTYQAMHLTHCRSVQHYQQQPQETCKSTMLPQCLFQGFLDLEH
jgi:hypothetical protein